MASSSESSVASSPPPAVPVDLNSLLELNLAYQDLVQNLVNELEIIQMENNQLQQEAAEILVIQSRNPKAPSRSFRLPYFVDSEERTPPVSEDKKVKDALGIRPLVPVKKWNEKEYVQLQEAVYVGVKRSVIARLLLKKNSLEEKLLALDESRNRVLLEEVNEELAEVDTLNRMTLLTKYKNERIDWLCISVIDFGGRRTDIELEQIWQNYIWPNVENPPWDAETIQKLETLVRESSGAPDWERIAEQCQKHVYQCWELTAQHNSYTKPLKITDQELVDLYNTLRIQDYVPWVKLADILQFTACMASGDSPRIPSQCYGRLEHLLGTVAIGTAIKVIESHRHLPRPTVPRNRKKANMVSWLLSTLMAIIDKVRLTCFLQDDPQEELRRIAPRIAKNCLNMLHCRRKCLESDTLDFSISKIIEPAVMKRKPTVVPGIKTIHQVLLPIIEKNILGLDSVSPVAPSVLSRGRKLHAALENLTQHNLLPPCTIMIEPTNGMFRRSQANPQIDSSIVEWIEGKLESSTPLQAFEQAFNNMFALTMIAAEVDLPEVKQLRTAKEAKKTRKGITFKRKRASKKPWMKARWKRYREMKAKEDQSENAEEGFEAEDHEEDDLEGSMDAGPSSSTA